MADSYLYVCICAVLLHSNFTQNIQGQDFGSIYSIICKTIHVTVHNLHCPILSSCLPCPFWLHGLPFPKTIMYSYCHLEKCSTNQVLRCFIPHKMRVRKSDSHILVWNRKMRQSPDLLFACWLFCFNLSYTQQRVCQCSCFWTGVHRGVHFLFFLDLHDSKKYPNASVSG